jgi:hypothetical protein
MKHRCICIVLTTLFLGITTPAWSDTVSFSVTSVSEIGLNSGCGSPSTGYVKTVSFASGAASTCNSIGHLEVDPSTGQLAFHLFWTQNHDSGGSIEYAYNDALGLHQLSGYFLDGESGREDWLYVNYAYFRGNFVITSDSLNTYTGKGFLQIQTPCAGCGVGSNGYAQFNLETPEPATATFALTGILSLYFSTRRRRKQLLL